MKLKSIMVAASLLCAMSAAAEIRDIATETAKGKGDIRVRTALDSVGLKYTVDSDDDFRLHWTLEDKRTHLVFVNSNTSTYSSGEGLGDIELREIWAVAFVTDSVSASNMQSLLTLNDSYKVGAWVLHKRRDGKFEGRFVIRVPAECRGSVLRQFTSLVAKTADKMEKITTDADKY